MFLVDSKSEADWKDWCAAWADMCQVGC